MGPLVKRLILETDVNSLKLTEVLLMILNYLAYISFGFNDTIERNSWLCLTPEVWKDTSHFSKNFSKKKTVHIRKTKIFFLMYSEQTSSILHGGMMPLSTTPTVSMNQFKRGCTQPGFWRGSAKTKLKQFGFFLYISTCELHIQLTQSSRFSRRKKLKWRKKECFFHHDPSRSFLKCTEAFTATVYTVLACFVTKWVNQSSQIPNSLKKNIG